MKEMKGARGLRVLRSVRLIRLFRIFKLGKYSSGMKLMLDALKNSVQPLSILMFFLCIGVVLFSSLLFYAEKVSCPREGEPLLVNRTAEYLDTCAKSSGGWFKVGNERLLCCNDMHASMDFDSITETAWWSIVTMTTVGYGDKTPRTDVGRFVGGLSMLCGILLISLPVAIVGSKFQEAYEEMENDKARKQLIEEERLRAE